MPEEPPASTVTEVLDSGSLPGTTLASKEGI